MRSYVVCVSDLGLLYAHTYVSECMKLASLREVFFCSKICKEIGGVVTNLQHEKAALHEEHTPTATTYA